MFDGLTNKDLLMIIFVSIFGFGIVKFLFNQYEDSKKEKEEEK